MVRTGIRFSRLLAFLALFIATPALAYSPPPNCPTSGGTQALNYATATNAFSCNAVSGGGSSVSITALDPSIVVSPSPITGTGTVTVGNSIKAMNASVIMNSFGGL